MEEPAVSRAVRQREEEEGGNQAENVERFRKDKRLGAKCNSE